MSYESLLSDVTLLVQHPLQDNESNTAIINPLSGGSNGILIGGDNTDSRSVENGPVAELPRSLGLTARNHYVQIGQPSVASLSAFTVLFWTRRATVSGTQDWAGRWNAHPSGANSNNNRRFHIVSSNTTPQFYAVTTNAGVWAVANGPAVAANTWHQVAAVATGSALRLGIDGVFGSDVAFAGPYFPSATMDWFIGSSHSNGGEGHYADFAIFSRALSPGEIADWFAGPSSGSVPENLSPPTLSIDSTSFTDSVGSWDAMGAGPLTYAWELRDDTDSAIISGTGTTISGSGSFGGYYYLWVRATNSVGSESAASSLVEAGEPEPAEGSGTASLTVSTAGEGHTNNRGQGTTALSASSQGEGWRVSSGSGQNTLSVSVIGDGYFLSSGYGESSLTLSTSGEGSSGAGGSGAASCIISVTGEGRSNRRGNGSAPLTVNSLGIGYRQSQGSGELPAIITTIGEGYAATGSYGETLLIASSSGQGYVIHSGAGLAAMQVGTVGNGQSTEPATSGILALQTIDGLYLIGF